MSLPALIDFLGRLEDNENGDINAGDMRFIITSLYEEFERLDTVFNLTLLADGTRVLDPEYVPTGPKSIVDIEYLKPFEESLMTALQTTGGTMTGILYLIPDLPESFTEAAHKGYVDFAIAEYAASLIASQRFIEAAGDTMLGPLLLNGSITQANQAVTKQYSDAAISTLDAQLKSYFRNYITTDATGTALFTKFSDKVEIRGLKASQNVTLQDDGRDITIKANVAGTGGDVRTDVDNIYDEGTLQDFDNIAADTALVNGVNVTSKFKQLDNKNDEQDDALGQESDARTANDISLNSLVSTAKGIADSALALAKANESDISNIDGSGLKVNIGSDNILSDIEVVSPTNVNTLINSTKILEVGNQYGQQGIQMSVIAGYAQFDGLVGGNSIIKIKWRSYRISSSRPMVICSGLDDDDGNGLVTFLPYDYSDGQVFINVTGSGSGSNANGINYLIIG